ncbi:MAG: redoxin domain-containing protein, partial [Fimbriimonadales bacterium]
PEWQPVSPRGLCVLDGWYEHRLKAEAIRRGEIAVEMDALIYAPGYLPIRIKHSGKLPHEATITLKPARIVELRLYDWENQPVEIQRLQGRSTLAYPYSHSPILLMVESNKPFPEVRTLQGGEAQLQWYEATERKTLFLGYGIDRLDTGRCQIALPEQFQGKLYLTVNLPDKIHLFTQPIEAEALESGRIEVRLPKPSQASFTVDFQNTGATEASLRLFPVGFPQQWRYSVLWSTLSGRENLSVTPEQPRLRLNRLAPGAWEVSVMFLRGEDFVDQLSTRVQVPEDGAVNLTLRPEPFDPAAYRGTRRLTLKVRRAGNIPAANLPYRVELYVWPRNRTAPVAQGRLDKNGIAQLRNLYETPEDATEQKVSYLVYVNDEQVAQFDLQAGIQLDELVITLPPKEGEPAPDIEVLDLRTNKSLRLQSLRGKWVYLEFWATWCGPCQSAMQALKEAVDKYGAQWQGRLEILTVSVDNDRAIVMPHLKKRGWERFARHAWDFSRRAADAYGVRAIPTAFLIDPRGTVVWAGNPLEENPASKLNRYLQGGKKR